MSAHGGNTKDDTEDNIDRSRHEEDKSKRKKGIDTMKEAPETIWSQSADDVTMVLKIPDITTEVLKEADVTFTDCDLTVKLPDGRNWTWELYDEIHREDSKVKVKKRKMSVHMKKKISKRWPSYQSREEEAHISANAASAVDSKSDEALGQDSLSSGLIEDSGTQSATENTHMFADNSTLSMEPVLSSIAMTDAVGSVPDPNRIDLLCADSARFMTHAVIAGETGSMPPAESHTGIAGEFGTQPPTGSRGDTDLIEENGSLPDRNEENTEVLEKEGGKFAEGSS